MLDVLAQLMALAFRQNSDWRGVRLGGSDVFGQVWVGRMAGDGSDVWAAARRGRVRTASPAPARRSCAPVSRCRDGAAHLAQTVEIAQQFPPFELAAGVSHQVAEQLPHEWRQERAKQVAADRRVGGADAHASPPESAGRIIPPSGGCG